MTLLHGCRPPCPPTHVTQGLKRQELRDELYMQLVKQTRSNPSSTSRSRAWALFHLVASAMPPSKEFTGLISEYVHTALQASVAVWVQACVLNISLHGAQSP